MALDMRVYKMNQNTSTHCAVLKKRIYWTPMDKDKKIQYAFLDSGLGGIPYLNRLLELYPKASCAYIADTEHFPYGEKKLNEVIRFACSTAEKIIDRLSPQVIIIACNTISVSALEQLRKTFTLPFVGTVPAIKPAAELSKNKKIALLATERTVNDIYTQKLIEQFGTGCNFFMRADSVLIKQIEDTLLTASESEKTKAVYPAVEFFKATGVDTAVLGCTHFLHLRNTFIKECEPEIRITDSLEGVVNQALKISPVNENLYTEGKIAFYITSPKTKETEKKYAKYAALFNMILDYLV